MLSRLPAIRSFNRLCCAAAFAWLVVAVPLTFKVRPVMYHDFGQFYMGGVIARHGAWNSLYPIPLADSPYNPGLRDDSDMRPVYQAYAERTGVGNDVRFIQPPPDALLFSPLAGMAYQKDGRPGPAFWFWVMLSCSCAWGVAVLAGKFYELAAGEPSRASGVVTLLVGFSLLTYGTLRALNLEAPIALLLGLTTLELLRRDGINGASSLVLGAFLKYATLILLPLAIAMRRWRTIGWTALLIAGALGGSRLIMGSGPFREYARIFPLLARPYESDPNQSLIGFLLRVTHRIPPLPRGLSMGVQIAGGVTLIGLCLLIFRRFRIATRFSPPAVFAAAASLIGWMLIFNPLVWNKYHLFMCPFWGWLVWEARQSKWRMVVVGLAIAVVAGPWRLVREIPEPFNSRMLWAVMGMMGVAVARLVADRRAVVLCGKGGKLRRD